jgi:hypothetical protein
LQTSPPPSNTAASLLLARRAILGIGANEEAYEIVVAVGQMVYAASCEYVYYCSIAFSAVSIIAACLLGKVKKYMDDHVAVVIHKWDLVAGDGGMGAGGGLFRGWLEGESEASLLSERTGYRGLGHH